MSNRFVIFSPGYNCGNYAIDCIGSVFTQLYSNYIHVIVDDASNPPLTRIYDKFKHSKLYFHRNEENFGKCRNFYEILPNYIESEEDIIIELDLDDYLFHTKVLTNINKAYKDGAWITHSKFRDERDRRDYGESYPEYVIKKSQFRKHYWKFRHLRTYKYFLINKIRKEDLMFNGEWINIAPDLALGFPILEMGKNHLIWINDTQIFYHRNNPLTEENRHGRNKQWQMGENCRLKSKYESLD